MTGKDSRKDRKGLLAGAIPATPGLGMTTGSFGSSGHGRARVRVLEGRASKIRDGSIDKLHGLEGFNG